MKHILVIADRQGGKNSALKRALELQARTQAKITLLGFTYVDIKNPDDLAAAKLSRSKLEKLSLQQRKRELNGLLEGYGVDGKQVKLQVAWSKDISIAICQYCQSHPVDLVIKSGNRSETWLYTSTDWQLFRDCSAPVMITAGKSWKKKSRILASVDFDTKSKAKRELNNQLVAEAKRLAASLDDAVHLVFALRVPQVLADMDLIDPRKFVADKRKKLKPKIEKFCAKHELDPANVHIKVGKAAKVVPSIANKVKAD
ncbi:MAG: universal stress protein, partial [Cellvibrionaceae bacterium]|nr:universal stress protein [Cellvibrionaceae bacterium]